jgi:hypothetical protein
MTGQDSGFRAAVARFKADVEGALTRARRAAAEAKEQAAEFRSGSDDLTRRTRTGRGRPAHHVATSPDARAEAVRFRNANGLPIPEAHVEPAAPKPKQEDEDFAEHTVVLFDIDSREDLATPPSALDQTSDESASARIDSPRPRTTRPSEEGEDFSQQRILFDATVDSYRPDAPARSAGNQAGREKPS